MFGELPEGSLAYRQYEVSLRGGAMLIAGVTLDNIDDDSPAAALARSHGATSHGLLVIVGIANAPQLPLVWMDGEQPGKVRIGLSVEDEGFDFTEELREAVGRVLATFLEEVAAQVVNKVLSTANDNYTVH